MPVPLQFARRFFRRKSRWEPGNIRFSRIPGVEILEDRTLLSGQSIIPLALANGAAGASDFLSTSSDYRVYQLGGLAANENEIVTAAVDAQQIGSGLNSELRVFDNQGPGGTLRQIAANDDFEGLDSRVTFQTVQGAIYYVGVSASGNDTYDPTAAPNLTNSSIAVGATHGLFELRVTALASGSAAPDLEPAFFSVSQPIAAPGDTVSLQYRVENRGGAAAGPFSVQAYLSTDNQFGPGDTLLDTLDPVGSLGSGDAVTGSDTVTLPGGLAPGSYYVGIVVTPSANDNPTEGNRWAPIDILTPLAGISRSSLTGALSATSMLNGITSGTLGSVGQEYYNVTVGANGLLTARVQPNAGDTELSLFNSSGTLLAQSAGIAPATRRTSSAST